MKRMKDSTAKESSNSAVFKIGAISLIFLVIGYQASLFINRAAMLGIEAIRDNPDTVYVVQHLDGQVESYGTEEDRSGSSNKFLGKSRKQSVVRTDTIRRNATHSSRVMEARARTRRVESFRFNPNTVSIEELQRLGFSEKQAQAIDNYRKKGGRFARKEDFGKSFVVPDSVYRRLENFIHIPTLDINLADSAAFDDLPGIGPYFAAKMVAYRKELGGYSYIEQLLDIYNFGQERFDKLKSLISCSPPKAFALWELSAEELKKHPYIKTRQAASAIVLYRENTVRDSLSVRGISLAGILPKEDADRLAKCRIAPP